MIAPEKPRPGAKLNANLYDELIVDNFAGGGGASMGIADALGRCVDVAINHDREAVAMHSINHPHTRHLCEDVWAVDPLEATAGRPVGLAWFSPDCKHFSKAKGGKPVSKKIRGLAWVVIRWAKAVHPRVIVLENVEEFSTWGPLDKDDKPCPQRKGQTFKRWWNSLVKLGYQVERKELRACDYGAPTIRKRLFIVARCDGLPIVWPAPTHARPDKAASLGLSPWRTAAECIDWSMPCPSIFERRRPLAENTLRRIANGIRRYVLDNPRPFIVRTAHSNACPTSRRWGAGEHAVDGPLPTLAASKDFALCNPHLVTANHGGDEFRGQSLGEPMRTLTASRDAHGLVTPIIAGVGGRAGQSPERSAEQPMGTMTAKGDTAIVAPVIVKNFTGVDGVSAKTPLPTVTSIDHNALATAHLTKYHGAKNNGEVRGQELAEPLLTQDTQNRFGVVAGTLVQTGYGEREGQAPRAPGSDKPLGTVVAGGQTHAAVSAFLQRFRFGETEHVALDKPHQTVTAGGNHHGLVAANLTRLGQTGGNGGYVNPTDAPLTTITSKGEHCLTAAALVKNNHGERGGDCADPAGPLHTVTTQSNRHQVAAVSLEDMHGNSKGADANAPAPTITAQAGHLAEVRAFLTKYYGTAVGQDLADPMHTVTARHREGLVTVEGVEYQIADIGLRMLEPVELYKAQGFPMKRGELAYVIAPVVNGKRLSKAAQVRMVGNSVSPPVASAIVRANCADMAVGICNP